MIEGLEFIKSQGGYSCKGKIETISRGKDAVGKMFKVKKEYKSKTAKQAEKQS